MQKYQSKVVEIEAIQLTEEAFTGEHPNPLHVRDVVYCPETRTAICRTNYGPATANIGDWLIRTKAGEVYPCSNEVFQGKYELRRLRFNERACLPDCLGCGLLMSAVYVNGTLCLRCFDAAVPLGTPANLTVPEMEDLIRKARS